MILIGHEAHSHENRQHLRAGLNKIVSWCCHDAHLLRDNVNSAASVALPWVRVKWDFRRIYGEDAGCGMWEAKRREA